MVVNDRFRLADPEKLRPVQLKGGGRTLNVARRLKSGSKVSLAADQTNQLSVTLLDDDEMSLWRNGNVKKGTRLVFNGSLRFDVRGWTVDPNAGSVQLTVRSSALSKLRDETGAKNWGKQNASKWMADRFRSAGLTPVVEPGLGSREFQRQKAEKDAQAESTWDVMARAKDELGCWLFEAGPYGVFGRPSWLAKDRPLGQWKLSWSSPSVYSAVLGGSPTYSYTADSSPAASLSFKLLAWDAGDMLPGDVVQLSGSFRAATGVWLVKSVDIPLDTTQAVSVECVRANNPVPQKAG